MPTNATPTTAVCEDALRRAAEGAFGAYQVEGIRRLAESTALLLADEMGLGKTFQAIRAAEAVGARRILIIGPAVAKSNWGREVARFYRLHDDVEVVENGAHIPAAQVVVVNFDILKGKLLKALMGREWDVVIVDEAHYLKNHRAKRTAAVYGRYCRGNGLASKARRVWLLTGTPMPNTPDELWTHFRVVFGDQRSLYEWTRDYCKMRSFGQFEKVVGARNMDDLKRRMAAVTLRRTKAEVLADLPPLIWDTAECPAPAAAKQLAALETDEYTALLVRDLVDAIQADKAPAAGGPELAALRRLTGLAKVGPTAELAEDVLLAGRKVIVFAWHRDVLDALETALASYGVARIDGAVSSKRRQEAVDAFQTDDATRVFIGQVAAAGTAITLTAASDVLFCEADWVPANNHQAAARAHRIGQHDSVLARYVTLSGSLDALVTAALVRKSRMISDLLD